MRDVVIFGAGGLGKEVLFELHELNIRGGDYNILGFVDDLSEVAGKEIHGVRILGGSEWLINYDKPLCVVIAVGSANARRMIHERISKNPNLSFPTIIAHDVLCSEHVTFGEGCIICFSDVLTVDISVGSFVLVNNDCTVGHDAVLDDFVTLYPSVNVSGNVHINEGCEIGVGSCIIQGKTVGKNTIVGAGAVVVDNLPSDCTAVGVPARVIKRRSKI